MCTFELRSMLALALKFSMEEHATRQIRMYIPSAPRAAATVFQAWSRFHPSLYSRERTSRRHVCFHTSAISASLKTNLSIFKANVADGDDCLLNKDGGSRCTHREKKSNHVTIFPPSSLVEPHAPSRRGASISSLGRCHRGCGIVDAGVEKTQVQRRHARIA